LVSGEIVYNVIDTGDPAAQPEAVIRTGDTADLPEGGTAAITGIGMIPRSGGQDGRPRACNDGQLAVNVSLSGTPAIAIVDLDPSSVPPTSTPTGTSTSTPTAVPTATPSVTPIATRTPTPSATRTSTRTPTQTPTTRDGTPLPTSPPPTTAPPTATPSAELDFGDAPDNVIIPGRPTPRYPTLLGNSGARHIIAEGFFLGQLVDADADGQPNAAADGDDRDSSVNDEDGVRFETPLRAGATARLDAMASELGRLDAWIDFDADGAWTGTGEQVLVRQDLLPGSNQIDVAIPVDAALGVTFARFRLSRLGGLSFDGPAPDGEVEDHAVEIVDRLRGDANCDGVLTAADLPAVVQVIGTGVRVPCGRDDANGDGTVDRSDVDALIGLIFAP
jgi:hypothetical protein